MAVLQSFNGVCSDAEVDPQSCILLGKTSHCLVGDSCNLRKKSE